MQQDSPRLVQQKNLVPSCSKCEGGLDDSVMSAENSIDSMAEFFLDAGLGRRDFWFACRVGV